MGTLFCGAVYELVGPMIVPISGVLTSKLYFLAFHEGPKRVQRRDTQGPNKHHFH